jgi:electron transfer flavoprotein beta subunit
MVGFFLITNNASSAEPATWSVTVRAQSIEADHNLDQRFGGLSAADESALETALVLAEAWSWSVVAVSAGPTVSAEALVVALSAGCKDVLRIDCPSEACSASVAHELGRAFAACDVVVCGDYSLDRGSGSTPAFLAAETDRVQALGVTAVLAAEPGTVIVDRRLEAGRRERLRLAGPLVISVEPQVARLRRGSLQQVLAARSAIIPVLEADQVPRLDVPTRRRPFRPRAKHRPTPTGSPHERIASLIGLGRPVTVRQQLELSPVAAADRIIGQLEAWEYLEVAS